MFYREIGYASLLQMIIRNQSALKIQRCWRNYSLRKRRFRSRVDIVIR